MSGFADVKTWKICLKVGSKREGPQELRRFWKGEKKVFDVELVEVRSCNGEIAKACGSFFHLGSLTDNKGSFGPEIRKRIKKSSETFRRLWRVWVMNGLPVKLKSRLRWAFVHSMLLYNCEVWDITETEMKALVGRNGYLMRRLVGEVVRSTDDKRLTENKLLEMLDLDSIQSLIRKRNCNGSLTVREGVIRTSRGRRWGERSKKRKVKGD